MNNELATCYYADKNIELIDNFYLTNDSPFELERSSGSGYNSLKDEKENSYFDKNFVLLSPVNSSTFSENIFIFDKLNDFQNTFLQVQLNKIKYIQSIGDNWAVDENIPAPNNSVLGKTRVILEKLAHTNIFPDRITPSAEEGICIVFRNNGETLYFELYNDGDMGYIIENRKEKKILENEDIEDLQMLYDRLKQFIK
jgi:hypothetical protein